MQELVTKFTNETWDVANFTSKNRISLTLGIKSYLAVCCEKKPICIVSPKETETEEDIEHAFLIAAAPEMLIQLYKLCELLKNYPELEDEIFETEELIERAIARFVFD
jgi:hypothetical protein